MSPTPYIDAHQHFWQIARGDYDWMTDEVADIRRDILPPDLRPHLARHGIHGTVVVQAAATVEETEFLLGLAAGTEQGAQALMLYLTIYVVMNIGVFAFLFAMERDGTPVVQISDLAGLAETRPAQALAFAVLMLSLAGLPPLVGFFAKFFAFKAAVDAGLAPLAVAGAIASVIGAYYYLNIVRVMYLSEPGQPLQIRGRMIHSAALGLSALVMAAGWLPFLDGFGIPEAA